MRVCGTSYSSSASPASSLRGRTPANPRRLNPLWSASIFPITLDIPPSSRCRNTSTLVSTRSTSQPKPRDEEAPMLPPTHFRRLSIATPGPLRPEGRAPPSFSFSPSENGSPVLEAALAVLESERARVAAEKSALEQSLADGTITDPKARARILREIRERTLDLGHSDLELQSRFLSRQSAKSPVNASEPESITLADLKRKRFEGFVVPRLLRAANQAGLFVDAFPGLIDEAKLPEANLEVNFGRITQGWEGCYGHPIPPNWALNSPGITITLPDDPTIDNAEPRLFTLIMADLDRPNPNTRSVEEWCHWLVTNIPVRPGHPLVVPEGSSPYLGPPITAGLDSLVGTSLHPSPAAEPAAWPAGSSVVLPYVPLHPANENPRRLHRYVFALLEQSKPLDIQVEPLRLRAIEREVEPLKKVPQWQRRVESEAEVKLGVCERGGISIWGMAKEHGLKLAGYAFVRSIWNVYTSEIFTRLGVHEPVYGEPSRSRKMVFQVKGATELAESLVQSGLDVGSALTAANAYRLNTGGTHSLEGSRPASRRGASRGQREAQEAVFRLPTRLALEAKSMREAAAAAKAKVASSADKAAKAKKSKGKSAKEPALAAPAQEHKQQRKLPRVTVLGSVGLVKAKQGDVARGRVGPLTRSVVGRRGTYQNV